ncbi:DUF6516 family protein [Saccharospirillum alexandrii]|uniref:DUF6516 family protein n=1 Tax=Saccharospirillum alexandrii TaxID=2448477 RepID=UPI000FD7058D|nr:DUF6516 family protein [Saccharospirillum alexandrii]
METAMLAIDKMYSELDNESVTAEVIDGYICTMSMNMLKFNKRKEHILELATYRYDYWQELIRNASLLFWLTGEGRGWAVYLPTQDCGYTRIYRFKPNKHQDIYRDFPWDVGEWRKIKNESVLMSILDCTEYTTAFTNWKKHILEVNKIPSELAEGRISNTSVEKVMIITKGNGCAVCGKKSEHHASTTMSSFTTAMLSISLCEEHKREAEGHPCVLDFFASLFLLKLDLPELIKLDYIPDELVGLFTELIASHLEAETTTKNKMNDRWNIKIFLKDGWYWILRLKKLSNYAYLLYDPSGNQIHRIDSANHHPHVPFGPSHQHFNLETEQEAIRPSFTYGAPILDFPLLKACKRYYSSLNN